jgi:hypothetical protein
VSADEVVERLGACRRTLLLYATTITRKPGATPTATATFTAFAQELRALGVNPELADALDAEADAAWVADHDGNPDPRAARRRVIALADRMADEAELHQPATTASRGARP